MVVASAEFIADITLISLEFVLVDNASISTESVFK
jgi:hypothetical protein